MPGRVLLSRNGIRISKPGVEVSTAGINNLLLNIGQRQGQILEHGFISLTSRSSTSGVGPWDGTASIGPYNTTLPDVLMSIINSSNVQMNMPVYRTPEGLFSGYSFSDTQLTANQLKVTIISGGAPGGYFPPELSYVTYMIFRKPQLTT